MLKKITDIYFFTFFLFYLSVSSNAGLNEYFQQLALGRLPENPPSKYKTLKEEKRNIGLNMFGTCSYPSKGWIEKVGNMLKKEGVSVCLSVMSGQAWAEKFISEHCNLPVIATDNMSGNLSKSKYKSGYNVLEEDALSAIDNHPEANALIMIWPSNSDIETSGDIPLQVLKQWNKKGPVVYVGEPAKLTCVSEDFMNELASKYRKNIIEGYTNPLICAYYDKVRVYIPRKLDTSSRKKDNEEVPESFRALKCLWRGGVAPMKKLVDARNHFPAFKDYLKSKGKLNANVKLVDAYECALKKDMSPQK
jgi:hypothetical protein